MCVCIYIYVYITISIISTQMSPPCPLPQTHSFHFILLFLFVWCVFVGVCTHTEARGGCSMSSSNTHPLSSSLETRFLIELGSRWAASNLLWSSRFCFPEYWGYRWSHDHTQHFVCVLGIWTPVITLAQQVLLSTQQSPQPPTSLSINVYFPLVLGPGLCG